MRIYRNLSNEVVGNYTACIGFFDGVHRGHRFLLEHVIGEAKSCGSQSAVVTFANHPRTLIHPEEPVALIQSYEEKMEALAATGVDACFVLDFTEAVRCLSAREFLTDILAQRMHITTLVIGYDHRFGHNRTEGFEDYVRYGRECGMRILQEPVFDDGHGGHYSSSEVRRALSAGEVERATQVLGRKYRLSGVVIGGHQLGRRLGYPTANLRMDHPEKLLPATGVYAVRALLPDGTERAAMLNIGTRPTVSEGDKEITLEAHIVGFKGDLYGQTVAVDFVRRLRDEMKFDSLDALRLQLEEDCRRTVEAVSLCSRRPK
jgi:riboflavin kinase/FMN adenylyltransferase